jgi:hypothetical protein
METSPHARRSGTQAAKAGAASPQRGPGGTSFQHASEWAKPYGPAKQALEVRAGAGYSYVKAEACAASETLKQISIF